MNNVNQAMQLNIDAAYRELHSRDAQGEDVSMLRVCERTAKIVPISLEVTPLQAAMIKLIARNEFTKLNGGEPEKHGDIGWVWASSVIEDAQDKGVFTSLVNAGLAEHCGNKGRDACVTLTVAGFKAYKNLAA